VPVGRRRRRFRTFRRVPVDRPPEVNVQPLWKSFCKLVHTNN
jgi:hypothetical protein